ncbi:zinc finger, CCHC-type containing protein [Tanacetum coccineum]
MMTGTEFDIEKFDGKNDFGLWQVRMKALLEEQGLAAGGVTCSHNCKSRSEHIDEFQKLVGNLVAIDTAISDEDQALLSLTSLPSSYDNFVDTLLYGRDTLKLKDVLATLNSRELQKMTEAKGDGGEGLYVRRRSGQRDMEHGTDSTWLKSQERSSKLRCYICQSEEHLKRDCPRYNHKKSQGFVKNEDQVSGSGADGRDYLVDFEEYDGGNILLGDGRECRVRGTCKVQVQMRDGLSFVLDNVGYVSGLRRNLISLGTLKKEGFIVEMQSGKIKVIKGLQQQNGLVEETNVTLLAKVVLYRNMGFNESGEYKKTFIGSGVGTGLVQVLQGVEFEVEPQEDHTFEVEPHGNVDHVAGSQEVQTQDLIYYHSARDREQHLAWELFSYREDSNEAAFAVAAVDKIYAHESLTFNNTVACEVISKWKAGLKDDMDALGQNGMCSATVARNTAEILATKGLLDKAKGNVLGMKIVRDQSGNTLRVSQSRFYNGKLVQTLLEGHSILSLEGSLSGDCDVEKNGKWSCIYAVGSQEYQMVCTRLDIASADVGMLDKFDRGLQTDVHVLWILTTSWVDQSQAGYMTLTKAAKEAIWLKGLAIESGFELKIVAGIATGALSKAIPSSRHAIRTWLVMRHRLKTQDRLKQWDVRNDLDLASLRCPLCKNQQDTHEHLFFECSYAAQVWKLVLCKAELPIIPPMWSDNLGWLLHMAHKNNTTCIVGRLLVAASSYYVWQERNNRIHNKGTRNVEQLGNVILDVMHLKLASIKFWKNIRVDKLNNTWKLAVI